MYLINRWTQANVASLPRKYLPQLTLCRDGTGALIDMQTNDVVIGAR